MNHEVYKKKKSVKNNPGTTRIIREQVRVEKNRIVCKKEKEN